jgi:hypothetical protein
MTLKNFASVLLLQNQPVPGLIFYDILEIKQKGKQQNIIVNLSKITLDKGNGFPYNVYTLTERK